jgi:7-cyano-7-deazaguanine synthase
MKKQNVVLSLSGGMDSSTLLLRCLQEYQNVTAISFDYGQKHQVELERASELTEYIAQCLPGIEQNLKYRVIKLDGLTDLLNSIHAGDHAIYPDCRQEFRDADDHAFRLGNWGAGKVNYFTPYLEGNKYTILQDGQTLCEQLGLSFNEVYRRTNTSYKPIQIPVVYNDQTVVKEWFSDYKSASSVERILAFFALGCPDPVNYADEFGPVSWETALKHALEVEETYYKNNQ